MRRIFHLTKTKIWIYSLAFIFLHVILGWTSIQALSATYDEPVHLAAGVSYLKTGNYKMNGSHHPAFGEMWPALGAMTLNPTLPTNHPGWLRQTWPALDQYSFADTFLYQNQVPHDQMLNRARGMQMLLSIACGVLLLLGGIKLIGSGGGLLAMGFWSVSPTLLAHGTLVTTDLPFALFFFSFFLSLCFWKSLWGNIGTGVSLALCFTSKYPAIAIGPILVVLGLWQGFRQGWGAFLKNLFSKDTVKRIILIVGLCALIIGVVYRFTQWPIFFEGLNDILNRSQAGRSSFFFGDHKTDGWLLYFPALFLLKTPIPLIISLVLAGMGWRHKKILAPSLLVLPPLLFFLLACTSKVQIGHRHLLAIYPFLFLLGAWGVHSIAIRKHSLGVILWSWMLIGTLSVSPYYLSYFNESIGGPSRGYHYFTDSNVDWGQGMRALSKNLTQDEKEKGIFMSYFGVADPHAYGIQSISVGSDTITGRGDDRAKIKLLPTLFALSLTNYQSTYYRDKTVFDWIKDKTPIKKIAYSIFLYDLSDDHVARKRLAALAGLKVN